MGTEIDLNECEHFLIKSIGPSSGPTLKTLAFTFYIGSTPTFLYFNLYLNTAYAAHYIYFAYVIQSPLGAFQLLITSST